MTPPPDETVDEVLDELGVLEKDIETLRHVTEAATWTLTKLRRDSKARSQRAKHILQEHLDLPREVREFLEKVKEG